MALETKITYVSQDRSGRQITLRDTTGIGGATGYPVPSEISSYYFTLSRMFDSLTYTLHIAGQDDYLPTVQQIAYGNDLVLTTDLFTEQTPRGPIEPSSIFFDGVLDVNMYTVFEGLTGVQIVKDTNFIVGGDFSDALLGDAVVVNEVIYKIDKSIPLNGSQVLYIIGGFEEDATAFSIAYRANTKALLTSVSENLHDYACKQLKHSVDSPDWKEVIAALCFRRSAYGFFNQPVPDYFEANDLVLSSYKYLKKFTI